MRIRAFRTFAFTIFASFLLVVCSTAITTQSAQTQSGDADAQSQGHFASVVGPWAARPQISPPQALEVPNIGPPIVTSAQIYHDDLSVYGESGSGPARTKMITLTFLESITSGISAPQGTVATIGGQWYVTNSGTSTVLVFQYTGSSFPLIKTLEDSGQVPGDVDTNEKQSLVAVSNIGGSTSNPATISLYAHGSTKPTGTLHASDAVTGVGVALDAKGNCFWSYETASAAKMVEFVKCAGSPTAVTVPLTSPGGIAFDGFNNLYYSDPAAGRVYRCKGVTTCTPFTQLFADAIFINFDQGWKHLWIADFGSATIYGLTKAGKTISVTPAVGGTSDPPLGIAPIPGSKY